MPDTSTATHPDRPASQEPPSRSFAAPSWWPWALGIFVGLVVLGPGSSGGSLLSLDLLVTPDIPIPNGVYGLGPALSQRVPMFALLGVGSALVGGPVITKVFIVASIASGFAGSARLVRVLAPLGMAAGASAQVASGLLWAAGPYALTRTGVGHINLLWVVAVLPWAIPRLCRPGDHLPSTFLASLALAIGGPGGGTLGLAVVAIALVWSRPTQWFRAGTVAVLPHAIWVLPTIVILWAGAGVTGANGFPTAADGATGWFGIPAGGGFWRTDYQVGAVGWSGAVVGAAVLVLAGIGGGALVRGRPRRSWPVTLVVVAVVGIGLALASAVPGVRSTYGWLSDLPVGAPLRESQRFLALWLVGAAPAAAIGGLVLAERVRSAGLAVVLRSVPLVVAVAASVPGWWGVDGRLEPVDYPEGWAVVRDTIADAPGTAIALPWGEYPVLSFADGRQVFNPMPEYMGGDVISSYDPVFDRNVPRQEQVDQRALVVDRLADRAARNQPIAGALADLGVRYVILAHEVRWEANGGLVTDPGLRRILDLPDIELFEVVDWPGPAVGPDGEAYELSRPLPPLLLTDAPAGSVLNVAGAPGWVQGWSTPVSVTSDGRLRTEGSGGIIWFWPAPILLGIDGAVVVAAAVCWRSRTKLERSSLARAVTHE